MGIMDSLKGIFGGKKNAPPVGNPAMPGQPQQPVSPGMPTTPPVSGQNQPPMGMPPQPVGMPSDQPQQPVSPTTPSATPDMSTPPTGGTPMNPPIPQ